MSLGLIAALAGLALVDSTSFGTLGVPVFLMVAGDKKTVPRLLLYLATISLFYFLVGVALMLGLSTALNAFGDALNSKAAYWIQLAVGVGLFLLSYRFDPKWRAKRGLPERRFEPRMGGPRAMVGLALTAGLVEVATMVPYLAAVGIMSTSKLPAGQWLPLLAGYVLVMVVPALALLTVRAMARTWLDPRLERLRHWLATHSASAVSWTLAVVGVLLALNAIGALFGDQ
jgi:hypothetical protein